MTRHPEASITSRASGSCPGSPTAVTNPPVAETHPPGISRRSARSIVTTRSAPRTSKSLGCCSCMRGYPPLELIGCASKHRPITIGTRIRLPGNQTDDSTMAVAVPSGRIRPPCSPVLDSRSRQTGRWPVHAAVRSGASAPYLPCLRHWKTQTGQGRKSCCGSLRKSSCS